MVVRRYEKPVSLAPSPKLAVIQQGLAHAAFEKEFLINVWRSLTFTTESITCIFKMKRRMRTVHLKFMRRVIIRKRYQ
jgi:hypothetical protein